MLAKNFNLLNRKLNDKIAELAEKEESLRVTFHSIGDGVISTDTDGKVIQINSVAEQLTGWKSKEVFGKLLNEIFNIISETDGEKLKDPVKEVLLTGKIYELENHTVLISKDGTKRNIADSAAPIKNEDGNINGVVIIFRDVTGRKQTEKALKSSEVRFRTMFEQAPLGIALVDSLTGYVYEVNPRFEDITGRAKEELVNIDWLRIDHLEDIHEDFDNMALFSSEKIKVDKMNKRYIRPDGSIVWINMTIVPIGIDDKLNHLNLCMIEDTTENKKQEERLKYLSFHDGLTDLYNRAYFEEELLRLDTKRQLPLGFIMGDLNGLKIINDTFGHGEGDIIIKNAAEILKKACRSDDIIARWGGDEFVVLLPKTTVNDAEEIIKRIKIESKKTVNQKIPLSISLGAAIKVEANQDIQAIILDAENNMYKNKLVEKESLASSIMFALEQALYEKSKETKEHTDRIKELAVKLGKSVKLHANQLDELSLLSSLHDIGKVAISEEILMKEGKLTEKEWEIIRRHPEIGFNIAQSSPKIARIAKYILACHENWDGSGYPRGLKKELIPLSSRIIFIADSYDVMTSGRKYKKPMSKAEAIKELRRYAGTQFDPILVEKFIEILSG
jgi:diguanylate cyclase (GGDEF)-like protein/PAS domain S-box-containing protein